ncbi:MAG: shikimate dehydrogenase [Proteobacteria bacterium]|nr:shikimate dehydrogenase [Pseudomonadota bacterium]
MIVTGETGVYCIIGYPIAHSLSPAIHNAGFEVHGLNLVFVPFALHPDDLSVGMKGLQALGVRGMTVTVPLKELAYKYMDETDEAARLTGAVNTVVFENGKRSGYNLDVAGVRYSLEKLGLPQGSQKAVVLGAGGAARAVIAALLFHKTEEIVILNRGIDRAYALRDFFSDKTDLHLIADALNDSTLEEYLPASDIIVNTTSVGMYPNADASPLPKALIPSGTRVLDAIYLPEKTKLLSEGEEKGCSILPGMEWLVHQATLAFKLWTDKELDKKIVMDVLEKFFAARTTT